MNIHRIQTPETSGAPEAMALAEKKKNGGSGLDIGIPKETTFQENRIGLTPSSVAYLTANGHQVVVETGAGKSSHFEDRLYSEAGAAVSYTHLTLPTNREV